jgi:membrane protease YdiL (CAAX protease family)
MQTIDPAVEFAPAAPRTFWMFRGPSAYVPHTPWSAGYGTLAAIGVFVAAALAVGTVLAVAMMSSLDSDQVLLEVAGTLLQQAVMIAFTWYAATRYGGRASEVMALGAPAQGWKAYVISFALLMLAAVIMSNVIRWIDPNLGSGDVAIFKTMLASQWWWLTVILVGIGAPLSEELLTRGLMFSALAKSRLGVWGASLLTSGLWAAVHIYSPVGMVQVFVIGMLFSWVLVRTGSLRVTIICHGLYNTLMAVLLMAKLV